MRSRIVISAAFLIAVGAGGAAVAVTHHFPFGAIGTADARFRRCRSSRNGRSARRADLLTGVGTVIAYNTVVVRSQIQDRSSASTSPKGRPCNR